MSGIRRHKNSAMYKGVVLTLILSQVSQTVWTSPHPLLPEIATVPPFDLSDDSNSRGDSSAAAATSSSSSSSSSDEISFEQQQQHQQHELKNGGGGNKETREIHSRPQPGVGDRLCSLFRTFLEARRVNCGYSNNIKNRHQVSPFQIQSEDQAERMFLHERINQNQNHNSHNNNNNNNINNNNPNNNNSGDEDDDDDDDVTLLESNNLIPPPLHRSQIHSSDLDDSTEPRLQNIPPGREQIPLDENGEPLDETKIIRSKTMIIVPERPCPLGKRRDIHGYCRTVINLNRFQPYTNVPPRNGPVRFYYRRYVQVPTLHFILP